MNEEYEKKVMETDPMFNSWIAQMKHALETAEKYRSHMHPNLSPGKLRAHILGKILMFCAACTLTITPVNLCAEVRTDRAVLHHTASPDWSAERIRRIHVDENGWDDIGYHFLIRMDGTVEEGRSLQKNGAHAKGRNHLVGIALTGYDTFSPEQFKSLETLQKRLGIRCLERHHEHCPGPGVPNRFFREV